MPFGRTWGDDTNRDGPLVGLVITYGPVETNRWALEKCGQHRSHCVEGYVDHAARTCACFADAFFSKTIRGVRVF